MALVLADRVRETTTVTGTGTATLLGAVSGYQSFAAVGNANTTYYVIANQSASEWEVGIGTYTSSGTTLSRTTVLSSSNGGSLVNFSAGTKDVFVDYPASKAVYEDASGNIDSYPITNGTINNTTVGATTPAAGTFTTLTAQTEVLKGTGQNFLTYSQTFQNAAWIKQTNVTATDNATTAPDGTTTAASVAWASATNGTGIYQYKTGLSWTGISNTKSIYVRADVAGGTVVLVDAGYGGSTTTLTLSTSWQRVTVTESAQTNAAGLWVQKTASSPNTIYVWGGQLELGSTANTYIPTTTTAVYGTPTLSFSGVSTIGLQSDGSLYVQPAGTGALQAQATTSSATGGNARGANAVDWQTTRSAASQVASGSQAVLVGGQNNTVASSYCALVGGVGNTSNGFGSFLGSGNANSISGSYGVIGSGNSNTATKDYASVLGGNSNTATGYYNFIGGGFTNSGTANAAVTTQSGTMNATTAVTLSGSNASIKVGQIITGTSIASETYVAAISGTSLTLSKNASGSSTSTLSFYTPHGVVVGGGNNQATGSYSFIGGGGDAGTAANRNVASGAWSVVVGGAKNTASGNGSFIGGGGTDGTGFYANTASGSSAGIVAGINNTASSSNTFVGAGNANVSSGFGSVIIGGYANTANGAYSFISCGVRGTTRSIDGYHSFPASNNPIADVNGVSQAALLVLGTQTTDATATVLRSNTATAGTQNQIILPNNSAYYFKGSVIANVTGAANGAAWEFSGAIMRGANAGSTVLIGTPVIDRVASTSGASAWTIALTADTTNGGLAVTVTGAASTTIRWVSSISTTEVTF